MHTSCLHDNEKIIVFGGIDNNSIELSELDYFNIIIDIQKEFDNV